MTDDTGDLHGGLSEGDVSAITRNNPEAVEDVVAGFLAGAANVSLTHDDAAGVLSISADGTNTQLTDEQVQDIVGAFVSGGSNASVSYDDANNVLTVSATDTQLTDAEVGAALSGQDIASASDPATGGHLQQLSVGDGSAVSGLWGTSGEIVPMVAFSGQNPPGTSTTSTSYSAATNVGVIDASPFAAYTNITEVYISFSCQLSNTQSGATTFARLKQTEPVYSYNNTEVSATSGGPDNNNNRSSDRVLINEETSPHRYQIETKVDSGEGTLREAGNVIIYLWGEIA